MHGILNDQSLIYLQIARMLEDDILRGIYQEEEQVPSTNELARGYNINPATAAKGINTLVAIERGEGNPKLKTLLSILDTLGLQMTIELKS